MTRLSSALAPIFSFRLWSWLATATIVVPLSCFLYQNWVFSTVARERARNGAFVCGTGFVLMVMACFFLICILWAGASMLGTIGYLRLDKPRPRSRLRELWLIVSTLVFALGLMAAGVLFS